MKILVIDDDVITLKAIAYALIKKKHEVLLARDGNEALEKITSHKFDLIISDVLLPGISGLTIANLLKRFYFYKSKIILISAMSHGKLVSEALQLGIDYYIPKPISFKLLQDVVASFNSKK